MVNIADKRKMSGEIKKFDKVEHALWDTKGKNSMIDFLNKGLTKKNLKAIENPNEHGVDVLVLNSDDVVVSAFEVEVRYGNWKGDTTFPFREINCIERKEYIWRREKEFFDKIPFKCGTHLKVYYAQLNDLCNRVVLIEGYKVLQYEQKHWRNRKSNNEYVRQVPIEECVQYKMFEPENINQNQAHNTLD